MKNIINNLIKTFGYQIIKYDKEISEFPPDFTEKHTEIIKFVSPFTMTTRERIYSLIEATEYITNYNISGSIVECGVWRGGSMMTIAKTLSMYKDFSRDLYLFDTFEGMPVPDKVDVSVFGMNADSEFEKTKNETTGGSALYYASLDEVKNNLNKIDYDKNKIHFIKGKVENTIPENSPEEIALLRLDTDWYESTKHELIYLFPRLKKGGVLIIDDYGHWKGAKKAVDEYFADNNIQMFLNRIDYTGRIGIKK